MLSRMLRALAAALALALLATCGARAPADAPAATVLPDAGAIPQGLTTEGYHTLGHADAPVTLVMYSDFFCTICASYIRDTEPRIRQDYIAVGRVKLVYRHLMQLGDGSVRAAEASECAADQGQFWRMRDALYARQREMYGSQQLDNTLLGFAKDLGLDTAAFGECMSAHKHLQAVQEDYKAAQAAGVQFRPVFDIGTARLIGALPFTTFQKQLDAELAK